MSTHDEISCTRNGKSLLCYRNDAIKWLVSNNPKIVGCQAWLRFEKYFQAETVGQYLAKGGLKADLLWDKEHGFLQIIDNKSI